jgi:hypothetical protein
MIKSCPLALSSVTDKKLIKIAESYLPFETGIEIECGWLNNDVMEYRELPPECKISNLIDYSHDNYEKRFRIPSGIKGMICLYNITEWLKLHCGLNEESGIHYHINMGDFYKNGHSVSREDHVWILKSLDKWKYDGIFNERGVSDFKRTWVTTRENMGTLEFRLGEMTFEYELLIKRIMNCQNIVRKIKSNKTKAKLVLPIVKKTKRINYYL